MWMMQQCCERKRSAVLFGIFLLSVIPLTACGTRGEAGPTGAKGVDGQSVTGQQEAPGTNCTSGGVKYVSANDTNYVCNGAAGSNGKDGAPGPGTRKVYTGDLDGAGNATISVSEIAISDMPLIAGYVYSTAYAVPGYVLIGNIITGDGSMSIAAGAGNANAAYIVVVVK